jgi:outer membrane protein OmpA-like peptidoglycan-associated protein
MSKSIIAASAAVVLGLVGRGAWADPKDKDDEVDSIDKTSKAPQMVESRVFFEFDSAELGPQAVAELDKAAQSIKGSTTGVILIEGHTDEVGDPGYNKQLAERRAQAAKTYLVDQGVPEARIKVVAYGEGLPMIDKHGKERVNRRIVLFALDKPDVQTKTEVVKVPVQVPAKPIKETVFVDRVRTVRPEPIGIQVMAGGGLMNQLDGETSDVTEVGGLWEARVAFFNRSVVGFEAAYIGSVQTVNALGLDDNAQLLGNGAELNLRINLIPGSPVRPYLFGGVGWTHYDFTNTGTANAAVEDNDEVIHIPAGVGLGIGLFRGMTLDLRGTARAAFEEQTFEPMEPDDDEMGLENWSASAQVGFEF